MKKDYRDFNRLDPRLFKGFLAAAHTQNFTTAASKAAMTQSGISQQVAKLEEQIGVSLFSRVNKNVILTDAGKKLVEYIDIYLDGMDNFLESVTEEQQTLSGRVSYSMPDSCLLSPHLGLMLERKLRHPEIELDISIASNKEVYGRILEDQDDFGFVTEKQNNPALDFTPFCKEEIVLVCGPKFNKLKPSKEDILSLPFIIYPGMDIYFDLWAKKTFPESRNLRHDHLKIQSRINQLDGVKTMLEGGLGFSVIPKHCIEESLKIKTIFCSKTTQKTAAVFNQIYIVSLKEKTLSKRTQQVINWFLEIY